MSEEIKELMSISRHKSSERIRKKLRYKNISVKRTTLNDNN